MKHVHMKGNRKYRTMEKCQGVMNVAASKEAIWISKGSSSCTLCT